MPPRALRFAGGLAAVLALAIACGCSSSTSRTTCALIPFADGVAVEWTDAVNAIDFAPTRLCARDGRLHVTAVFVDRMPAEGGGFAPRINQTVARDGEQLFVFGETRAPVPFRAIPDGTHPLEVPLPGAAEPARGFSGTSAGSAIAYLRWRAGGVTRELAATLRPVFTEADLVELVQDTVAAR